MKQTLSSKNLIAKDQNDLNILSALLQDAVLTAGHIGYDQKAQRFAFIANRFLWEDRGLFRRRKGWRQRTAFHLDHVKSVKTKEIRIGDPQQTLSLLTIMPRDCDNCFEIDFIFSDRAGVKVVVDSIDAVLTDTGDPWEALGRPNHKR